MNISTHGVTKSNRGDKVSGMGQDIPLITQERAIDTPRPLYMRRLKKWIGESSLLSLWLIRQLSWWRILAVSIGKI